jgi:hypothetical protein
MFIGLKLTRKSLKEKRWGMLGFPFLFVLYQIFWAGAIYSVIRGKKIKWK